LQKDLKDMKIADTAEKANQVADSLARTTRESAANLRSTADNLRNASESLDRLMERLEAKPSDLLFGR